MSLAAEMRDFLGAFKTVHDTLGTVSSREGQRLDNEYRRATIDYTRARTAEIGGTGVDFGAWVAGRGGYSGTPLDTSYTEGVPAAPATSTATGALNIGTSGAGGIPGPGGDPTIPNPPSRPATTATGTVIPKPPVRSARVAAVGEEAELPRTEVISGTDMSAVTPPAPRGRPSYQVSIGDHTSWRGMQPKALQIANVMGQTAQQMGIRLVATAGAGGGHRSHGMGTESDWMGYHADGSKWTRGERARIAAAGGSVGANRFGLYPGGSLHVGYSGPDRPSAVWGAHGILNGGSARDFTDPADRQFLALFQGGKLYGSSGQGYSQLIGTGDDLSRARSAIAALESRGHGDYAAKKGDALGRYMIRVGNLPEWSKAALGREVTPEEFMANPEIQDAIFDSHFGSLYEKYGNVQDAASAWFTGRPLGGGGAGAHDANITGREYVDRFNKEFGATTGYNDYSLGQETDVVRGTPRDDSMPAYPDSATPEADPAVAAAATEFGPEDYRGTTRSAVPAGTPNDIIHTVVKNDTLTKLAKKYNLESYDAIYQANKAVIGDDPDKLSIGQQLRIPGVADPASFIPDPQARPDPGRTDPTRASAVNDADIRREDMAGLAGMGGGGLDVASEIARTQNEAAVRRAGARDAEAVFPKVPPRYYEQREAAVPVDPTFEGRRVAITPRKGGPPTDQRPWWDVFSEPQMIDKGQDQAPLSTEDYPQPAIQYDFRPGHPVLMSPDERLPPVTDMGVTPVDPYAPPGTSPANVTPPPWAPFDAELGGAGTAGAQGALGDVGTPSAAGEALTPGVKEEPISGTDMSGVDDGRMSVIETAIREASGAYNVTSYGHMVHPNGSVAADSTFTSGRKAAIAGSSWLSRQLGLSGAVDDEPPGAPDDGTPTAASAKLSGKFAAKQSEMAQAQVVVQAWADKNGIPITESELNVRSLGLVFDYWLSRGEPEKAQAIAAAMFQYHQVRYNQYSAIAKAALGEGDHEKAVEAAIKAYAQIPDGRDIAVSGDAASGWKVRYTDEETGKVINEKILSPAEMEGMIMNMAPGDVDKFLAKAAHQEELPEASPQLVKILADIQATPDGVRPVFNAVAFAELDSAESQIALEALRQQMSIYEEFTGGAAGRDRTADLPALEAAMAAAGTPGAATPPATPALPADDGAAVPTTAPTTGTPASEPGAGGGPGSDTIEGSSPIVAEVVRGFRPGTPINSANPDVYQPGDDKTYGVGGPADVRQQVLAIYNMRSNQGGLALSEIYKDAENRRVAEIAQRKSDYQIFVAKHHGVPIDEPPTTEEVNAKLGITPTSRDERDVTTEKPFEPEKSLYDVPGTIPIGTQRILTQEEKQLQTSPIYAPSRTAGIAPVFPPRPPIAGKPMPDGNVLAIIAGNTAAEAIYNNDIAKAQYAYDETKKIVDAEYAKATDLPKIKEYSEKERTAVETQALEPLEPNLLTVLGGQDAQDHLTRNSATVAWGARTIGEQNHIGSETAVKLVQALISVNPKKPTIPGFVAVPHPLESTMMIVQPLGGDGRPQGQKLLVPNDLYDAIITTWTQRSEDVVRQIGPVDMGEADTMAGPQRNVWKSGGAYKVAPPMKPADQYGPVITPTGPAPAVPDQTPPPWSIFDEELQRLNQQ